MTAAFSLTDVPGLDWALLVTGAGGYLGCRLGRHFLGAGDHHVVLAVRWGGPG